MANMENKSTIKRDALIGILFIGLILAILYVWLSPAGLQPAPVVSMKTLPDGRTIDLQKLRGRPVLITFWATSCPGCIKEMPHLIELYNELNPKGLEIIGVAMNYDRPDHVMAMQKSKGIPYPIVWDGTSELATAFGQVRLTPSSFLINPDGQIVQQTLGEMDMHLLHARILTMLKQGKA